MNYQVTIQNGAAGAAMPPAGARMDSFRTGSSAYRAASLDSQETFAWRPPLTSGDSATLFDRNLGAARVRDLLRNDPHAVAGITRLVDMLVGAGLHLSPRPNARALGLDPTNKTDRVALKDMVKALKSEFSLFAEDPRRFNDAQRKLSFNGQLRLLARTYASMNEATAFLSWRKDGAPRYATCLRIVDPDRLSNPMGRPDSLNLRGGIEFTDDGEPMAYHVRKGHQADYFRGARVFEWTRIPRATSWGRPIFIHGFEPDREDQSRAMTPFAALMTRMRMIGKFADSELATATVNALFAAFVHSNMPIADATQAFTPQGATFAEKRNAHYAENPAFLNGVRIPVLPIGDEVKINSASRATTAFASFQTAFLQSIASALGISYEQLSMDWSKVNYSSARAALNEVWRHVQTLFAGFVEQVVVPIYFAQVEEAFDRGYITPPKGCPDFWDMPGAYLGARWIGPGRGYVDPVKEAEASSLRMGSLTSTLEDECADVGKDWEEVLDQSAIEEEELKERGLMRIASSSGSIAPAPNDAADAAEQAGEGRQAP